LVNVSFQAGAQKSNFVKPVSHTKPASNSLIKPANSLSYRFENFTFIEIIYLANISFTYFCNKYVICNLSLDLNKKPDELSEAKRKIIILEVSK
jgi:hypothetical protein